MYTNQQNKNFDYQHNSKRQKYLFLQKNISLPNKSI